MDKLKYYMYTQHVQQNCWTFCYKCLWKYFLYHCYFNKVLGGILGALWQFWICTRTIECKIQSDIYNIDILFCLKGWCPEYSVKCDAESVLGHGGDFYCVPSDLICDLITDCPLWEDESQDQCRKFNNAWSVCIFFVLARWGGCLNIRGSIRRTIDWKESNATLHLEIASQ